MSLCLVLCSTVSVRARVANSSCMSYRGTHVASKGFSRLATLRWQLVLGKGGNCYDVEVTVLFHVYAIVTLNYSHRVLVQIIIEFTS
jgi:hypothetical protein